MSLCEQYPIALPLNYCGDDQATIHLGTLSAPREEGELAVLLTNAATGRKQICEIVGEDLDLVDILHPSGLSPGTVYRIQVVGVSDVIGIAPVPFFPYDKEFNVSYTSEEGVYVKFVKIFDGTSVHSHDEQYIILP